MIRKSRRSRIVFRVFVPLVLVYCAWLATSCALQRRFVFPREMTHPLLNAGEKVATLEKFWIDSDQGKIEAWFIPGRDVDTQHPGPVMIYAHGNAELIDRLPQYLSNFTDMGISLLLCEFRGYGRSAGSPSQKHITDDYLAAYDIIIKRPDVDALRVIFYGRSLGTGVVCSLAVRRKPAAMILKSPFISVKNIMAGYGIPPFCVLDPFDNEAALHTLHCPVLLLHGKQDHIIPLTHSQHLKKIKPDAQLIEYDAGHNDFPIDTPKYRDDVRRFLQKHNLIAQ